VKELIEATTTLKGQLEKEYEIRKEEKQIWQK
jgi:hypothetical protein